MSQRNEIFVGLAMLMDDQEMLVPDGRGGTKCQVCGKVFSRSRNARRHYNEIHLVTESHSCTICGRSYSRYRHYKAHMLKCHNIVALDHPSGSGY
jgi:uncharacterized C2H2 Zn-finger protein